jgi:hypothetical protein
MQYPEAPETPLPDCMSSRDRQRRMKLGGQEFIASKLTDRLEDDDANEKASQARPFPLYRRFEELNHRILLHLQEEISELEEDLHNLDEKILEAKAAALMAGQQHPSMPLPPNLDPSFRHGDTHAAGHMRYRRTELLGRIFVKLGQYSE